MNASKYVKPEVNKLGPIGNMTRTNSPNQVVDVPEGTPIENAPNQDPVGPFAS